MKSIFISIIFSSTLIANADDWYNISLKTFKKVEVTSSSQIVLEQAAPNWDIPTSVTGLSGACQSKRIVLNPPNGFLSTWLSMILAGQSAGKNLWVNGNCAVNVITSSSSPNNRMMLE